MTVYLKLEHHYLSECVRVCVTPQASLGASDAPGRKAQTFSVSTTQVAPKLWFVSVQSFKAMVRMIMKLA